MNSCPRVALGKPNRQPVDGAELCVDLNRQTSHDFVPMDAVNVRSALMCSIALKMTSATTWGCESMIICDPLDLGDSGPGALRDRADNITAGGLVAHCDHRPA